ncbi:MAG: hypothetical protein ACKVZ6_12125 [Kineosporiaceae bacterium]
MDGRPTGLLVVPGRGRGDPEPLDVQVVAAVRSTGREVVVSGAHAARIWGLPKPLSGWGRRVLLATAGPTRTTRELRIRVAPCVDGDVLRLPGGLLVTSPRRTVVDCLRTLAPPDALAVADAALRAGLAFDRFDVPQPQWQTTSTTPTASSAARTTGGGRASWGSRTAARSTPSPRRSGVVSTPSGSRPCSTRSGLESCGCGGPGRPS